VVESICLNDSVQVLALRLAIAFADSVVSRVYKGTLEPTSNQALWMWGGGGERLRRVRALLQSALGVDSDYTYGQAALSPGMESPVTNCVDSNRVSALLTKRKISGHCREWYPSLCRVLVKATSSNRTYSSWLQILILIAEVNDTNHGQSDENQF
jgi:hypothetical protein